MPSEAVSGALWPLSRSRLPSRRFPGQTACGALCCPVGEEAAPYHGPGYLVAASPWKPWTGGRNLCPASRALQGWEEGRQIDEGAGDPYIPLRRIAVFAAILIAFGVPFMIALYLMGDPSVLTVRSIPRFLGLTIAVAVVIGFLSLRSKRRKAGRQ